MQNRKYLTQDEKKAVISHLQEMINKFTYLADGYERMVSDDLEDSSRRQQYLNNELTKYLKEMLNFNLAAATNKWAIQKYSIFSQMPFTDSLKQQADVLLATIQRTIKLANPAAEGIDFSFYSDEKTASALSIMFSFINGLENSNHSTSSLLPKNVTLNIIGCKYLL